MFPLFNTVEFPLDGLNTNREYAKFVCACLSVPASAAVEFSLAPSAHIVIWSPIWIPNAECSCATVSVAASAGAFTPKLISTEDWLVVISDTGIVGSEPFETIKGLGIMYGFPLRLKASFLVFMMAKFRLMNSPIVFEP